MTDYFKVIDATWPAAAYLEEGPWCIRVTSGAGSRVSAISTTGAWTDSDIDTAIARNRGFGQRPLFMIRAGEDALDAALAARGFTVEDPVVIYTTPTAPFTTEIMPYAKAFAIWPRLAIMNDLWDAGGIGAGRRSVMDRADCAKAAVLGRIDDRAAGVAYVGLHDQTAMMHAVEVSPRFRRKGVSGWIMRAAAHWVESMGGNELSLVTTRENVPANAAYTSMGMQLVGHYHYRRDLKATT